MRSDVYFTGSWSREEITRILSLISEFDHSDRSAGAREFHLNAPSAVELSDFSAA